jgi:hypothetical protein
MLHGPDEYIYASCARCLDPTASLLHHCEDESPRSLAVRRDIALALLLPSISSQLQLLLSSD